MAFSSRNYGIFTAFFWINKNTARKRTIEILRAAAFFLELQYGGNRLESSDKFKFIFSAGLLRVYDAVKFVFRLEIQPELRRRAEIPA